MIRTWQIALAGGAATLLAGCVGPNFAPPVPVTAASRGFLDIGKPVASPVNVLAGASDAPVEVHWWHAFHDAELSKLESRVADENLDVRTATLRLAESRAQRASTASALLPTVSANASDYREQFSQNSLFKLIPIQSLSSGSGAGYRHDPVQQCSADRRRLQQLLGRVRRLVGGRSLGPCGASGRGRRCPARGQCGDAARHLGLEPRRAGARLRESARHPGPDQDRQGQHQGRAGDPRRHPRADGQGPRHRARCRERRGAGRIGEGAGPAAPGAGAVRHQRDQPASRRAAARPVRRADRTTRDPAEPAARADRPAIRACATAPGHPYG